MSNAFPEATPMMLINPTHYHELEDAKHSHFQELEDANLTGQGKGGKGKYIEKFVGGDIEKNWQRKNDNGDDEEVYEDAHEESDESEEEEQPAYVSPHYLRFVSAEKRLEAKSMGSKLEKGSYKFKHGNLYYKGENFGPGCLYFHQLFGDLTPFRKNLRKIKDHVKLAKAPKKPRKKRGSGRQLVTRAETPPPTEEESAPSASDNGKKYAAKKKRRLVLSYNY